MKLRLAVLAVLLAVAYGPRAALSQLSAPVAQDSHVSVDGNKFLQHEAELDLGGAA
jgi:hypothetical protein